MRRLKIIAVCGHGQGSSLVMRMTLENVIADMGIDAIMETTSVAEATGMVRFADVIVTTHELAKIVDIPEGIPLVTVKNMLNTQEVAAKLKEVVEEHYPEAIAA